MEWYGLHFLCLIPDPLLDKHCNRANKLSLVLLSRERGQGAQPPENFVLRAGQKLHEIFFQIFYSSARNLFYIRGALLLKTCPHTPLHSYGPVLSTKAEI